MLGDGAGVLESAIPALAVVVAVTAVLGVCCPPYKAPGWVLTDIVSGFHVVESDTSCCASRFWPFLSMTPTRSDGGQWKVVLQH